MPVDECGCVGTDGAVVGESDKRGRLLLSWLMLLLHTPFSGVNRRYTRCFFALSSKIQKFHHGTLRSSERGSGLVPLRTSNKPHLNVNYASKNVSDDYSRTSGVLSGIGEVNVARKEPSLETS